MEIVPATFAQVKAGRDGRNVLVEDDVFEVARQLKEIDSSLCLRWNERGEYFVVYQLWGQGQGETEKLVLTSQELTPAILERVRQIVHPSYDFAAEMDRMDAQAKKDEEHRFAEETGEVGEHLAHALRKDLGATNKAFVPKEV
jgi:hypothetical protein